MKFGFIGAGKVGQTFGRYLKASGYEVAGYYSRSFDHAVLGAKGVDGKAYETLEALLLDVDIVMLTVTDFAIEEVSRQLFNLDSIGKVSIIAHMSGAMTASIMKKRHECTYVSVHPLQAFATVEEALHQMRHTVFSLEGESEAVETFHEMLKAIGNEVILLTEAQKVNYHMAAVIVSNYMVTLVQMGLSQLNRIGIENELGIKALLPLIKGTLTNIEALGPEDALTGPIARGDYKTVEAHLEKLDGEAKVLYKALGKATLDLSVKRGLNKALAQALGDLLKEE